MVPWPSFVGHMRPHFTPWTSTVPKDPKETSGAERPGAPGRKGAQLDIENRQRLAVAYSHTTAITGTILLSRVTFWIPPKTSTQSRPTSWGGGVMKKDW